MANTINRELAATVLVSAAFTTDEQACTQYGVSVRSLQRWRRQLGDGDPQLAGIVATKKAALDAAWASELPSVLSTSLQAIKQSMEAIRSDAEKMKDPTVLHALAGAVRIVAEIHLTNKLIEARIGGSPSQGDTYTN